MKLREVKALKELSKDELQSRLIQLRQELMEFRFQRIRGQLSDSMKGRNLRKDIARMETFLRTKAGVK